MLGKIFLPIIFLFIALPLLAAECLITKALEDPNLKDNQAFWNEYGDLMAKGRSSDDAMKSLLEKFKSADKDKPSVSTERVQTQTGSRAPTSTRSLQLDVQKRAKKEMERLPQHLKEKVDVFLGEALRPGGIKTVRDNPGKYRLEKLPEFGPNAHSVRLSDGYRVLFDLKEDTISLREINKGHIHGN